MKVKLLFVCLGNICRSPSAEAVMKHVVSSAGLDDQIEIDSAGTIAVHAGEHADSRMRQHAARRGYALTSISRRIEYPHDFDYFDYIIGMDASNMADLTALVRSEEYKQKIYKMTDFCLECTENSVPDPYYGGSEGFEHVLDILEDACRGFLDYILKNNG